MNSKTIIALSIFGVALVAGFISSFSLTHVDRYYVPSTQTRQVSSVTCAWAHWTGLHPDEIAYCTDDASKAVDWVAKANASLK